MLFPSLAMCWPFTLYIFPKHHIYIVSLSFWWEKIQWWMKEVGIKICALWLPQRRRDQTCVEQGKQAGCYIDRKKRGREREQEQAYSFTILWPLPPALGSVPILLVSATCQALNYTALGFSLREPSIRMGGKERGGERRLERGMEREPQKE